MSENNETDLTPENLADQIMRWDWRDMFREENKKAIKEMFVAYSDQQIKTESKCCHLCTNICECKVPDREDGFRYCHKCNRHISDEKVTAAKEIVAKQDKE